MTNSILEIRNITKEYGDLRALDDFGFSLKKGEILGLLGPNGAGKTTLISILSGTLKDFSGSVYFKDEDLFKNRKLKNHMGIVPQDMAFYEDLNAVDNLLFWGGLYDVSKKALKERIKDILKIVNLENRSKEPVKNFSGGMKRRLNIAIGLIHNPELILLDEPTVGIDVQAKVSILEIIKNLGKQGTSVIFTTHQLSEVEEICTKILIMDRGKKLTEGTLKELIDILGEKEIIEIKGEFTVAEINKLKTDINFAEIILLEDNYINLAFDNTDKIPLLMELFFKNKIKISDLKIKSPNLETVFLKFTGRSLRD